MNKWTKCFSRAKSNYLRTVASWPKQKKIHIKWSLSVSKIGTKHVSIFLCKYISNMSNGMELTAEVSNNYINQNM